MVASGAILIVLLSALAAVITEQLNPFSDEFINMINSQQNSWRAGRNFPEHTPFSFIQNLLSPFEDEGFEKLPQMEHNAELIANLPESFDPRDKWPYCPSLNEIRDQGSCGSCWAFGAVEVMTDRYCIYSNGQQNFHFSAQDLLSCCPNCGSCEGGLPTVAWRYWVDTGIVSGGNYNSNQGCRPYEIPKCEHGVLGKLPPCLKESLPTPECVKSCASSYSAEYGTDLRRGKNVYTLRSDEELIKAELFHKGPVEAGFDVYYDFATYREGVYKHMNGSFAGTHAVKMLGWGVEKGEKYWLVANSWNSDWGDQGYFKILRGENHCGIESSIVAGEPLI